ncbi:hypothetical protein GH714_041873 [Hevea brasiliensis]|uniref:SHSP domain-containing protein n=1 Tax=Hevea brasiliensis TaxID=3981 RepID=A0A6A6MRK8_HEVBR|nr:hypothetical protein GH714_041873 [Hevea brasiliensis]
MSSLISQLWVDEIFDPFLSMVNKCPVLNTPTDWKETPEAHIFISDLPGLKKEEVKVEFDEGRLPENAKTDQVKASMESGVLVVTVPKEGQETREEGD